MATTFLPVANIDWNELLDSAPLSKTNNAAVSRSKYRGRDVAVKQLRQGVDARQEVDLLNSLRHRNIVQFIGVSSALGNLMIVTEFAQHGSLFDYIQKHELAFDRITQWAMDISNGMRYLHEEAPVPIIHRDLKSMNVLICDNLVAKICDFGCSKEFVSTTQMSFVGTCAWMAPEVLRSEPVSEKCDVYSFGVVLWEMLTGQIPFQNLQSPQVMWLVGQLQKRPPIPAQCPLSFSTLIESCWVDNPPQRPSFRAILRQLEFIQSSDDLPSATDSFVKSKHTWQRDVDSQLSVMLKELREYQQSLSDRELRLRQMERQYQSIFAPTIITAPRSAWNAGRPSIGSSVGGLPQPVPAGATSGANVNVVGLRSGRSGAINWTEDDVGAWLSGLGNELSAYGGVFSTNNIAGKHLVELDHSTLQDIGVKSIVHRRLLLQQIEGLRYVSDFPSLDGSKSGLAASDAATTSSRARPPIMPASAPPGSQYFMSPHLPSAASTPISAGYPNSMGAVPRSGSSGQTTQSRLPVKILVWSRRSKIDLNSCGLALQNAPATPSTSTAVTPSLLSPRHTTSSVPVGGGSITTQIILPTHHSEVHSSPTLFASSTLNPGAGPLSAPVTPVREQPPLFEWTLFVSLDREADVPDYVSEVKFALGPDSLMTSKDVYKSPPFIHKIRSSTACDAIVYVHFNPSLFKTQVIKVVHKLSIDGADSATATPPSTIGSAWSSRQSNLSSESSTASSSSSSKSRLMQRTPVDSLSVAEDFAQYFDKCSERAVDLEIKAAAIDVIAHRLHLLSMPDAPHWDAAQAIYPTAVADASPKSTNNNSNNNNNNHNSNTNTSRAAFTLGTPPSRPPRASDPNSRSQTPQGREGTPRPHSTTSGSHSRSARRTTDSRNGDSSVKRHPSSGGASTPASRSTPATPSSASSAASDASSPNFPAQANLSFGSLRSPDPAVAEPTKSPPPVAATTNPRTPKKSSRKPKNASGQSPASSTGLYFGSVPATEVPLDRSQLPRMGSAPAMFGDVSADEINHFQASPVVQRNASFSDARRPPS
ncbi:plaucible mixed-lineage kinase [Capsaspora owczarzaki ATCC 30864]|uniref:TKL/MLK protein kinase n=1 Tax=Capsaspora owczarzaki (strain ATCC 30864) TaxID=595528 RepID=A0A0D2X379_CAPO3|nr:plaucible mixed-lineage kinase [Capsaspora owczarzaki ATCC 30864]KJE93839.1 TKL/MLK protein kinase [Capsaspora owczarzaki ATCC 30864]|eukprot:XP_004347317.2 plaucible mixed-lineage kinase [Capsaspora owczarzaki ATCC 30864]